MFHSSSCASQPWRTLVQRLEKPITGLFLTLGLTTVGLAPLPANSAALDQLTPLKASHLTAKTSLTAQAPAQSAAQTPLQDGVYLYGQSPERDQLGAAYAVFEVNDGKVVGAFYMPRSSFDCFYGNVQSNQLALTIVETYSQTAYPYSVALESTGSVAAIGDQAVAPVGLEGYHQIENVNENDQRILSVCQANHGEQL